MDYKQIIRNLLSGNMNAGQAMGENLGIANEAAPLDEPARSIEAFAKPMGLDARGAGGTEGGGHKLRITDQGWRSPSAQKVMAAASESNLPDENIDEINDTVLGQDLSSVEGLQDYGPEFGNVAVEPRMMQDPNKSRAVMEIIRNLGIGNESPDQPSMPNMAAKHIANSESLKRIKEIKRKMQMQDLDNIKLRDPLVGND